MPQNSTNKLDDRQLARLREAWQAQRYDRSQYPNFVIEIIAAAESIGLPIKNRSYFRWNDFINWLDAHHPHWRGIQSPKVFGDGVKPLKRFSKLKQQSEGRAA